MARLINPGIGDICDRLTILALKALHAKAAGKPHEHFEHEQAALLAQVRSRTLNGLWFDQFLELGATNAALWQAEDELRQWREQYEEDARGVEPIARGDITQIAFRIQALNDRRSELISLININAGDHRGEEKSR
jgi:hypothetical protein